ncbi:MAG: glycosyltransferase [Alphaproteobacteria bacterium]|nr:glycosyltransferase [Alphaproteobacteria bacterium]
MTQEIPGVTYIVPVYNKARHLEAVLAAIRAQVGEFRRQYVFVDDGSTDGSLDQLQRLTAGWPDTVIVTQRNGGSARATNVGIRLASLPFLKFVDADDLLTRDATAVLLSAQHRTGAVAAFGDRSFFSDPAEVDLAAKGDAAPEWEVIHDPLPRALRNSLFNPTQFLAPADAVRQAGGCDERVVHSQEYSLTLRLARQGHFVHVKQRVAWLAEDASGRLSNDTGRQLQRVTRAVGFFVGDHPELPWTMRQAAYRRACGRAWKHQRRHRGAGIGSSWFWSNVLAYLPLPRDHARGIASAALAFDPPPSDVPAGMRAPAASGR